MINQRLYPDVKLGLGSVSIATDGCYLCSIHQGLWLKMWQMSIQELNNLFISKGVFAPGSALLSASTIALKVGNIFLEGRNEAWSDAKLIAYLKDPSYFVIGEVSGKGIGGTGQHFVKIDRVDVTASGTISMSYIDDPWGGLEDQKVTTRYGAFGNILSLRVFRIRQAVVNPPESGDMALLQYLGVANETEARAKLKEHLGEQNNTCDWGNADGDRGGFLGSARREIKTLIAANESLTALNLDLTRVNSDLSTANKQLTEDLAACQNQSVPEPEKPKGVLNGWQEQRTVEKEPDGVVIKITETETKNYTV